MSFQYFCVASCNSNAIFVWFSLIICVEYKQSSFIYQSLLLPIASPVYIYMLDVSHGILFFFSVSNSLKFKQGPLDISCTAVCLAVQVQKLVITDLSLLKTIQNWCLSLVSLSDGVTDALVIVHSSSTDFTDSLSTNPLLKNVYTFRSFYWPKYSDLEALFSRK